MREPLTLRGASVEITFQGGGTVWGSLDAVWVVRIPATCEKCRYARKNED